MFYNLISIQESHSNFRGKNVKCLELPSLDFYSFCLRFQSSLSRLDIIETNRIGVKTKPSKLSADVVEDNSI